MDSYTFDTSLGQTILSNFLHGFHSPRISQVLKYCLDFQSSTYPPSLLGLNLAQLMFKVSLPENALCWGLLYMFFFPFKIMDVLQVEKFQGQAYEIGLDFLP